MIDLQRSPGSDEIQNTGAYRERTHIVPSMSTHSMKVRVNIEVDWVILLSTFQFMTPKSNRSINRNTISQIGQHQPIIVIVKVI